MIACAKALCVPICVCLALLCMAADTPVTQINKIDWCIHAYCWSAFAPTPPKEGDADLWRAQFSRELRLHEQHMARVSNMKGDEAMVIYPIGNPALQTELKMSPQ